MTPMDLARMAEALDGLRASPAVASEASEPLVRRALQTAAELLRREAQRQERHEPPAR